MCTCMYVCAHIALLATLHHPLLGVYPALFIIYLNYIQISIAFNTYLWCRSAVFQSVDIYCIFQSVSQPNSRHCLWASVRILNIWLSKSVNPFILLHSVHALTLHSSSRRSSTPSFDSIKSMQG